MRRRTMVLAGGLLIAGITLLPGIAQAAVTHPVSQGALIAAGPSGPDIGGDTELLAADGGILSAFLGLGFAITLIVRRQQDRGAAQQLIKLRADLEDFRKATNEYRLRQLRQSDPMHVNRDDSAGQRDPADEKIVRSTARQLFADASKCGPYGDKVAQAARRLLKELRIEWTEADVAEAELEGLADLKGVRPSEAKQLIRGS